MWPCLFMLYIGDIQFVTDGQILFTTEDTTFSRCVDVVAGEDELIEADEVVSVEIDEQSLMGNDVASDPSQVEVTIRDNDGTSSR